MKNNNLPAIRKPLKKRTLALLLSCIAVLALTVPALACGHGHGHHGRKSQTQVTVCTLEDCETAGRHTHNGVTYCGYAHENGICDGKCLALCTVEGCTTAGRHIHNGTVYCGSGHEAGFCTGTCSTGSSYCGNTKGCHRG